MSVSTEVTRLQAARNTIRAKLNALGLVTTTANIDDCATAVEGITNNGTVTKTLSTSTTSYTIPKGYHSGSGKVSITTETKSATPSTAAQTITPSSGKVLSSVTVAAMATATQATPSISVSTAGLITASATQSAGYVAAGTKSATKQLTTQAAKTVTPSTSSQTAVASGVYTTGAVTVAAVPTETKSVTPTTSAQTVTPTSGKFLSSVSVGAIATETKTATAGTSATTVTPTSGKYLTSVTVNPTPSQSKTVTPSASQQTVSPDSGKLLSSVVVNGDSDLVADNIRKGVTIFGVTGSMAGGIDLAGLFGFTKFAIDKFTLSANDKLPSDAIPHSLGEAPRFALLVSNFANSGFSANYEVMFYIGAKSYEASTTPGLYEQYLIYSTTYKGPIANTTTYKAFANTYNSYWNASNIKITGGSTSHYLKAGVEYTLITMA